MREKDAWDREKRPAYMKEYNAGRRSENRQYQREYAFRQKYGITVEDYEKQDGRCAICSRHQTTLSSRPQPQDR